ncbi:metallophosphoesterase [Lutimonas sp.]|uniref:metallophosphoesterase n=1 Tax=Lutimonas sp. TaxID=1872403 RepID=UPI003D9BC51A
MSTRNISISLIWTIIVLAVLDLYVYLALRKGIQKSKYKIFLNAAYIVSVILSYVGFYYLYFYFNSKPLNVSLLPNLFIGYFFSFFAFKILLTAFFLFEDILRFFTVLVRGLRSLVGADKEKLNRPGRRGFIRTAGLVVAGIPFASMLYGITKGKYNFKVNRLTLHFENLPKAFEGFKILQISDIHSGSFDNQQAIKDGIEMINRQQADVILFTGDLVNNDSREVVPFIKDFKNLRAEHGVYSVLGNHDYGDYKKWDSEEAKQANMELLYDYQKEMGFTLLNNENSIISKEGETIGIYGVENWGNPPFPQRGDLDIALAGNGSENFKILMSHDPTHWDKKVIDHPAHFDLTLSGHTHGMQFGVEIPGFKWSPIKYIYPQWAGLYERKKQLLYVNRGFGFLGFPGRVGIWPEITVIELSKKV